MSTHTEENPFQYTRCVNAFKLKVELAAHLRTYTGEKPYECSQCNKAFTNNGNLAVHMRTHTGERPYQCNHCDKARTYITFALYFALVENEAINQFNFFTIINPLYLGFSQEIISEFKTLYILILQIWKI